MTKAYDPEPVEKKWSRFWEEKGLFRAEVQSQAEPYTVAIPPPNITGGLTIGHVLDMTIQDILIRWKRMEGYETLWLPGTDHAGIATQNAVEKKLAERGLTRNDLGKEKFVEEIWKWREKYGRQIVEQLNRLGCSCDWSRERFTLDEGLTRAVWEVFFRLWEEGLIYRGDYIINWCPRCRTALSNEEVEYVEADGSLYYLKYPEKEGDGCAVVATTRPETMLGDVALAVNPHDEKTRWAVGRIFILPLMERELPVIEDSFVDPEFGTGIVKVTPAHDPNDFDMGRRHSLEPILVMDEDGKMNSNAGKYEGEDRLTCRENILKDLEASGLLEKTEPHRYSVGHCYRCETTVEPYLSKQWFVKMKPLAESAIEAVRRDETKFYLERWKKVYFHWMENVRDWCISRQLWWGHRLPIWYCQGCDEVVVSREQPSECPACGSKNLRQDEDVLDTWFSSWLWPFSTLGWPEESEDLKFFYPTSALVTGWDIIFLWVARMIMAGLHFTGKVPFREVYFHGMVRDEERRKLSKSLGNSPDPIELIDEYGADGVRMGMMLITPEGQDVLFSKSRMEVGRNFANKVWNASRLILMSLDKAERRDVKAELPDDLDVSDRWILSRFNRTVSSTTQALNNYNFNDAAKTLYEFTWHEFCDWYVELIKPRLYGEGEETRGAALAVAGHVLGGILRLIHPFMPFISEELWQLISHEGESIVTAEWPQPDSKLTDEEAEAEMDLIQKVIVAIRNIKSEMGVSPQKKAECYLRSGDDSKRGVLEGARDSILNLAGIEELTVREEVERPPHSATAIVSGVEVFVPLANLIDLDAEKRRLSKELDRVSEELEKVSRRLEGKDFLAKAPEEVVARTEAKKDEYSSKVAKLKENLRVVEEMSS